MTATTSQESVQTRPSRCSTHGLVEGTRKMPRLRFPFIITGAMRLAAGRARSAAPGAARRPPRPDPPATCRARASPDARARPIS